ncbi:beta-galactosidase [Sugiyamaella lignohabitans]|uniref:beta-galactosidase n=1 Tax=Sugiyamaella lignohabitans TaxID=796027 RepID=A0A167E4Q4_9ASCO|nr:beta-galactosidase [Sugiyamaella lignohabitans]ANB13633.1 beta-galactosidase [Sugiyamaella lignohabitans]
MAPSASSSAPSVSELLGYIENPKIFQVNKLPPRSYYIPEDSRLLNGAWDFLYHESLLSAFEAVDSEFQSVYGRGIGGGAADNGGIIVPKSKNNWSEIAVPGHWQLQGFGNPQYTNIMYPIPMNPPYVPSENPTGVYRTKFSVKGTNNVQKHRLRFDGVDSGYFVFLNGHFVGYAQGSRNPAEFDVSHLTLDQGDNDLVVVVVQWCDGSYIEDQDQWWISGIFRDVNVISYDNRGHIEDFRFETVSVTDNDSGDVPRYHSKRAKVSVSTSVLATTDSSLQVDVYADGKSIASQVSKISRSVEKDGSPAIKAVNFSLDVLDPQLWSAESPYLYEVQLVLRSSDSSSVLQKIDTHLGIRTIEIKGGQFLVNNNPILLRGVNRHDDNSVKGRAVSEEDVKHDLRLMKRHNINTIRCSHYPSHPSLVHWADVWGFYIIDEADLECHGFAFTDALRDINYNHVKEDRQLPRTDPSFSRKHEDFTSDNPLWREAYLDRVKQLANRDKNHPSVIMWSLGNEAFFGENHVAMCEWLHENFSQPVHYEQDNGNNEAHYVDVYSRMYSPHWYVDEEPKREGKPFMLCEYGHAMGNGPGALKDYQDLFYKHPRLLGGCIWEWANHGLRKPVPGKEDEFYYAYGGDFEEPVHDGTFVMDGLCDSEHEPTPGLYQYKHIIQPVAFTFAETSSKDISIFVKNLNDHIDLSDNVYIQVVAELIPNGPPEAKSYAKQIIFEKKLEIGGRIPPGQSAEYQISIDTQTNSQFQNSEVIITATAHNTKATPWAEAGYEIAHGQHKLVGSGTAKDWNSEPKPSAFSVTETLASYQITSEVAKIIVSKATGKFNISVNGKQQIKEGPTLGFWRAPTDNDLGDWAWRWRDYHVNHLHESVDSVSVEQEEQGKLVKVNIHTWISPAVVNWGIDTKLTYTFSHNSDGSALEIDTTADLTPKGPYAETVPRIGLDFVLDDALSTVRWAGLDVESYPDTNMGKIGVHEADSESLFYSYEVPQENGNRSQVRWVQLLANSNSVSNQLSSLSLSSPATSVSAVALSSTPGDLINFSVQPWTPLQLEKAGHPYQLDPALRRNNFRVDFAVHGIGSASCGPGVLDQHKLNLSKATHRVRLIIS